MNESTKRQIRELREYAKNRRGEIADICDRAADKIEELAEKIDLYEKQTSIVITQRPSYGYPLMRE